MQREQFISWLCSSHGQEVGTANTRASNCTTVESAFGDLDVHYNTDGLSSVLFQLRYTAEDRQLQKPLPPGITIKGDAYNGLATLRQGVSRYLEFKNATVEGTNQLPNAVQDVAVQNSPAPAIIEAHPVNPETEPSTDKNRIILLPIYQLQGMAFKIGNYQRGYKWGKKEVLELLNDIHGHGVDDGIYCLQPLIVRPLPASPMIELQTETGTQLIHSTNEVIDGQQRTTTIYLMLSYLKHLGILADFDLYRLDFKTRARSGEFLDKELSLLFNVDVASITATDLSADLAAGTRADQLWREFANINPDFNNVDVYHFFTVAVYFRRWVEINLATDADRETFIQKLLRQVHVIWYSLEGAQTDEAVIDVFLNNNKGKILLTTSELIKALFVLSIKEQASQALMDAQIQRFALEWDAMEKQLQNNEFWYFIQPDAKTYKSGTRIDYLFDLHLKKGAKQDEQFSYRHYERMYNMHQWEGLIADWDKIIQLYNKLIDWYNDRELYHYVGFLTQAEIRVLSNILADSLGKKKRAFKAELKDRIKTRLHKTKENSEGELYYTYHPDHLDYNASYKECKEVLLLYNVLYYVQQMANHMFPFELYVKESWSIEHIIPQNPKGITDITQYRKWFEEQLAYQEDSLETEAILEQLSELSSVDAISNNKLLAASIQNVISNFESRTHAIENLLLLDRNTNSALQNESFEHKRAKILRFDRTGGNDDGKPVFIPRETLNAFNKTFSNKVDYDHWTKADGIAYANSIADRLQYFLPATNKPS